MWNSLFLVFFVIMVCRISSQLTVRYIQGFCTVMCLTKMEQQTANLIVLIVNI